VSVALHGHTFANLSNLNSPENAGDRKFGQLLQVYIPIRFGSGPVAGAFEIYETYGPLAAQIAGLQISTYMVIGGGLFVLYFLLFGIVGTGSRTIRRQQSQLEAYTSELEKSYAETIRSLASTIDARDSQTEMHSERVTRLALALGRYVGLSDPELQSLSNGAQLHDIGKIGIPDVILLKRAGLTDDEWALMRRHPMIGYDMLKDVGFLGEALPVIRHHHERWDGGGYPDGLSGEEIPVVARIFAIVDAFDAITSDRTYRRGSTVTEALARIESDAGTHFDHDLVAAFVTMMSLGQTGRRLPMEPAA
jgi:HD-GYP domain-containing protein (c-di-GMP phosphodiesterase class II)